MYKSEWEGKDFYKILGVTKTATEADIKKAYRKMARTFHPDTNSDPGAEAKFKEVTEAYGVVGDKEKRAAYDSGPTDMFSGLFADFNSAGGSAGEPVDYEKLFGGTSGFSDLDDILNRANRYMGKEEPAEESADPLAGLFGRPGTSEAGTRFRDMFDTAKTTVKDKVGKTEELATTITFEESCTGVQKSVQTARGEVHQVRIPAGIKDGQKVRLQAPGNPLVKVSVTPHDVYSREGNNLVIRLGISLSRAVNGGVERIDLPTSGSVGFRLPANCANKTVKLTGKGFKGGDALVKTYIVIPDNLNDTHRKAAEAFDRA